MSSVLLVSAFLLSCYADIASAGGCPDFPGLEAKKFWKEFLPAHCKLDYEDLPPQMKLEIAESSEYVTADGSHACRLHAGITGSGTDLGRLIYEAFPKDPDTNDDWSGNPDTAVLQTSSHGKYEEMEACTFFDGFDLPKLVDLTWKVDEIMDEVRKDFASECKLPESDLNLITNVGDSGLMGKRGDVLDDGSTSVTALLKLDTPATNGNTFKIVLSEERLTEEQEIEQKIQHFEEKKLGEIDDDQKKATDDTASYIQRRIKVQSIEPSEHQEAATTTDDDREKVTETGSVGDTLADAVGKLTFVDIEPNLCSLCGTCKVDYAKLLQDDDHEGKIKEQERLYPELQPNVLLQVKTPSAGSPEEQMPPRSPGEVKSRGHFRTRADPGYGDNFHSQVLAKRTPKDHQEVWAHSRALIETAKAEGTTVPETYHFFDHELTAGCFMPSYDQGKCGSCWAFASLGALEKQICMRARSDMVPSLSREMLVRCSEQNNACAGGNADKAYEDLMEIGGVFSTDCLPYQGEGSKHCPVFAYSWFGQASAGKTGKFARIDQELQKSCRDHTRYSNRPPMGKEWDMPFKVMYEKRFGQVPDVEGDVSLQKFRRNFAKVRSRDRVPSWWLYGVDAMKVALIKYGSIYASFMVRDDFKPRQCADGCWPPGTVYGEEPGFYPASCGCPKGHAVHIIGYGEDIQETGLKVPYWLIENSWGAETHGDVFGDDSLGVKGWGMDPFTELHPMGIEDKCVLAGWLESTIPRVGGCGGGDTVNIRDTNTSTPDGFHFSIFHGGNTTPIGEWEVPADSSKNFSIVVPFTPGEQQFVLQMFSKNHPKQQGAFDIEKYAMKATSLRCRGKGFRYSFTFNDTKANLSWGRKTRKELKALADAMIPMSQDPAYLYGGCPEDCRTGRYSWVKPCEGLLTQWGSCYTDSWVNRSNWMQSRKKAECWICDTMIVKVTQKAYASRSLSPEKYLEWFTLIEQAWTAPDEPGWMRQNRGSCKVRTAGWVHNAALSATYTVSLPAQDFCDERHSAPYAHGKFVHAPGYMPNGNKTWVRCPTPLLGQVTLECRDAALYAIENTCHQRPTAPHMGGLAGYYKMVRGVNYHQIESGAAFAIAEMNRFAANCPTLSWTKWSECNVSTPCVRGSQTRTREPIGLSKDDPKCAEIMFYEERPCVGPGFCAQVLTRFVAQVGSADISAFMAAYKKQSTSLQEGKFATAGAHMMESASSSCSEVQKWCRYTTGSSTCAYYMEGHFQVKKSSEYYLHYKIESGAGYFAFNSLGEGSENTHQYLVQAGATTTIYEWQDLGFHHRRRRTDTQPWAEIVSLPLNEGTYYARMTRTGWSGCPDFSLKLEQTTAVYTAPMLLGFGNTSYVAQELGENGQTRQKRTTWQNDWGAIDSWEKSSRQRGRHGYASRQEQGDLNEIILRDERGGKVIGKKPITKLNFTGDELYGFFNLNKFDLPNTIRGYEDFELVVRATIVLPDAGDYVFKYQVDNTYREENAWTESRRRTNLKFHMRTNGSSSGLVSFSASQGSASKSCSYKASEPGEVKFEISQLLQGGAPGRKIALPHMMRVEVKKADKLHGEFLALGSKTKYMSDLFPIRGDTQVRIDWPDRDDPLSSELKTQTFQEVAPHTLLIGHVDKLGFAAHAEVKIDAGACVSLEAWAKPPLGTIWGVGMNMCDVDGANQYLEMVAYKAPTTNMSNYSTEQIGWLHIGFTHPTHLKIIRDPADLKNFTFTYRPDDRLLFAQPFETFATDIAGEVDVGVSMNSVEAYRYAEFYNISIEDCPADCTDGRGTQVLCGEQVTACGTKLNCPSSCSQAGEKCSEGMCMACPNITLTAAQSLWECGHVNVVCTNPNGQQVQVWNDVGIPAPSLNHRCVQNQWTCTAKSKWAFLAEGKDCGTVQDPNCGDDVQLFDCLMEGDKCEDHKCKCYPTTFSEDFNCGQESDGCGREVVFGSNNGSCPNANDRCSNNICCSPKTKQDFPDTYQCGTASDGCGGGVHFSQAEPAYFAKEPSFSSRANYYQGRVGMEITARKDMNITALARGAYGSRLRETAKVEVWDVSSRSEVTSLDIGPDAIVDKGYGWVSLPQPVKLTKGKKYMIVQKVWRRMRDYWSRVYYWSSRLHDRYDGEFADVSSRMVYTSRSTGYPVKGGTIGSGMGIVNFELDNNEGCGVGPWTCHANNSCTRPPLPPQTDFEVESGPCRLLDEGKCVSSGRYPRNYGGNERCTIKTPREGLMRAVTFNTEYYRDKLRVNGRNYHGTGSTRFKSLTLTESIQMTWSSDSYVSRSGWKICIETEESLKQEAWLNMQGRECSQSSTSSGGVCDRGIDGNSDTQYFGRRRRRWRNVGSCTHTRSSGRRRSSDPEQNWWKVKLPSNYYVQKVKVTNRGDCCGDRLNGFDVLLDDTACASNQQINQGATKEVPCIATGQELKIRGRVGQPLTLCEVKVYGSTTAASLLDLNGSASQSASLLDLDGSEIEYGHNGEDEMSDEDEALHLAKGPMPLEDGEEPEEPLEEVVEDEDESV